MYRDDEIQDLRMVQCDGSRPPKGGALAHTPDETRLHVPSEEMTSTTIRRFLHFHC